MFDKKDTYFPIKQAPACQLKWTWSSLWLTEGTTASCHRCKKNFNRTVRGTVFAKDTDGIYYATLPHEPHYSKTFTFRNVPIGQTLKLVKLGNTCLNREYNKGNTKNL